MAKSIRERDIRSSVLKATITDQATNKVRFIETQEELVQAATVFNKKQQFRTEGTPFGIKPLLQDFGYCTDNKTNVKAVLNGTYICHPTTDKYAKEFIKALKIPASIRERGTFNLKITPA